MEIAHEKMANSAQMLLDIDETRLSKIQKTLSRHKGFVCLRDRKSEWDNAFEENMLEEFN